jgi:alpha-D-xyloside xylohydrolase
MLRAMVLEFPDDPNTFTMDLQYMLGAELLVAPIYNSEGRRAVYFPAGRWVDFWTHEVIEGPQTRWLVDTPLEIIPLYVRANALIPTIEPPQRLTDEPFGLVTFDAYLLDEGSFHLRDTDGVTHVTATRQGAQLDIRVDGVKKELALRLIPLAGAPPVESVRVNGKALQRSEVAIAPGASAGWNRIDSGVVEVMIR